MQPIVGLFGEVPDCILIQPERHYQQIQQKKLHAVLLREASRDSTIAMTKLTWPEIKSPELHKYMPTFFSFNWIG